MAETGTAYRFIALLLCCYMVDADWMLHKGIYLRYDMYATSCIDRQITRQQVMQKKQHWREYMFNIINSKL